MGDVGLDFDLGHGLRPGLWCGLDLKLRSGINRLGRLVGLDLRDNGVDFHIRRRAWNRSWRRSIRRRMICVGHTGGQGDEQDEGEGEGDGAVHDAILNGFCGN